MVALTLEFNGCGAAVPSTPIKIHKLKALLQVPPSKSTEVCLRTRAFSRIQNGTHINRPMCMHVLMRLSIYLKSSMYLSIHPSFDLYIYHHLSPSIFCLSIFILLLASKLAL